jgi:hypothetical protein
LAELVDHTIGRHRLVTLRVDAPLDPGVLSRLQVEIDPAQPRHLRARMTDVAADLPPLLAGIRAAGATVDDVEVRGPSLQAVFIHLTGRELRE